MLVPHSHSRHPQITFVGLCLIIMSHTMLAWFDPDLTGNAPSWVLALQGICLFVYSTLDNMDGKQARRTGSSSSLGLLFDHGMRRCLPLPATACCCVLTHAQHRLRCRQRRHAVGDVVLLRNRSASAPTPQRLNYARVSHGCGVGVVVHEQAGPSIFSYIVFLTVIFPFYFASWEE